MIVILGSRVIIDVCVKFLDVCEKLITMVHFATEDTMTLYHVLLQILPIIRVVIESLLAAQHRTFNHQSLLRHVVIFDTLVHVFQKPIDTFKSLSAPWHLACEVCLALVATKRRYRSKFHLFGRVSNDFSIKIMMRF